MNTKRLKSIIAADLCKYNSDFGIYLIKSKIEGGGFYLRQTTFPYAFSEINISIQIHKDCYKNWALPEDWYKESGFIGSQGIVNLMSTYIHPHQDLTGNLHLTLNLLTTAAFL